MPWNGSGTFSLTNAPIAYQESPISSADMNAKHADFVAGLNNTMLRDGQASSLTSTVSRSTQAFIFNGSTSQRATLEDILTLGVPMLTRAEAIALTDTAGIPILTVNHGGVVCHYQKDASGTALTSASGQKWSPVDGMPAFFQHWGAEGDGTTDDTTAVQAALSFAAVREITVSGTFLVQKIVVNTSKTLVGVGTATFLREASTATGTWVRLTATPISLKNLTIDANSGTALNGCNAVSIESGCLVYRLEHCTVTGAVTNSGWGSGVSATAASTSRGRVKDCEFTDNDRHGFQMVEGGRIKFTGNLCTGNGDTGAIFNNYDTSFTQKVSNVIISDNIIHANDFHGLSISNFIEDNNQSTPTYGYNNREVNFATVANNLVYANGGYGIIASASSITVQGNVARGNGTLSDQYAGIVVLGQRFAVVGNIVTENSGFGIDSGGGRQGTITGNFVGFNGSGTARPGLNLEASVDVLVTGNTLRENSGTTGDQIKVEKYGAADATTGFVGLTTSGIAIENNYIYITGSRIGISLENNPARVLVKNNTFNCADPANDRFRLIKAYAETCTIEGNTIVNANQYLLTPDGSGNLVWPDAYDYAYTNSATTIGSLKTQSMTDVADGVAYVTLTNGGSGYTSQPTVGFTGGGGSGATATALISATGEVTGIRMGAFGSGYTSAPTVTFTGGGGSGATATAVVGLGTPDKKRITLLGVQAHTITRLGDPRVENPAGADISVPAQGVVDLIGEFGRWQLASKNF